MKKIVGTQTQQHANKKSENDLKINIMNRINEIHQ